MEARRIAWVGSQGAARPIKPLGYKYKTGNVRINVTIRSVRVTTVAVEKP
jgi:hypothetical protein